MLKAVKTKKYSLDLLGKDNANMEEITGLHVQVLWRGKCNNNDWGKDKHVDNKNWKKNCIESSKTMFSPTYFRSFSGKCKKGPLSVCNLEEST
jgi:hypothetical protein